MFGAQTGKEASRFGNEVVTGDLQWSQSGRLDCQLQGGQADGGSNLLQVRSQRAGCRGKAMDEKQSRARHSAPSHPPQPEAATA